MNDRDCYTLLSVFLLLFSFHYNFSKLNIERVSENEEKNMPLTARVKDANQVESVYIYDG